ncbi:hypothetical protein HG537_0D06170 [Torulaspora globosa]|uniref:Coatomer subunit epsilon n=1 Tax=Torulaspora globosa TaxID=48254 RepID=A0A7H9HU60_9SACH|nr:hypothetical protein HG537_0D06170 [Torulaspora sp. CBS 2947]
MNYFTIKQSYYTGDYLQTLQEIAKANKVTDDTLAFYKHSASLALGRFEPEGSSKLDKAFQGYQEFLQSKDIGQLSQIISKDHGSPFELLLLALAESLVGNFEQSLQICVVGIDNDEPLGTPELLLLAVQVALLMGRSSTASTMLSNYTSANEELLSSEDELIVNLAESYIKFATNRETTRSNFYYFEELSQTVPTWKTQLALLNSHLQQGNLPEATAIVDLLQSQHYVEQTEQAKLYKPHFLASKITLSIALNHDDAEQLREELAKVAPEGAFTRSHRDLEAKFDELVAKYSS